MKIENETLSLTVKIEKLINIVSERIILKLRARVLSNKTDKMCNQSPQISIFFNTITEMTINQTYFYVKFSLRNWTNKKFRFTDKSDYSVSIICCIYTNIMKARFNPTVCVYFSYIFLLIIFIFILIVILQYHLNKLF